MADPIAILEQRAVELYVEFCAAQRDRGLATKGSQPSWTELENHSREVWRERALLDIRSKESVADELKREDRERQKASGR